MLLCGAANGRGHNSINETVIKPSFTYVMSRVDKFNKLFYICIYYLFFESNVMRCCKRCYEKVNIWLHF